jgi:hypothetical protein
MTLPALSQTTLLDAVNSILAVVGESPINTLTGPLTHDVALAMNTLTEASKEIQAEGWVCNTEHNYPLTPDTSGEIRTPGNIARVSLPQTRPALSVTLRGTRLYNLTEHSYHFNQPVIVTAVFLLDFDELTESLRRYIVIKAGRMFLDRAVGSPQLHQFSADDEFRARVAAREEDTHMGRWNIQKDEQCDFLSGWAVADALRR